MDKYLEINDLKVNFRTAEGSKNVLDIDSLSLNKGETFGLVGESGAGKSVLALTIMNLLPSPPGIVESGKIIFDGDNLLGKNENEMQDIRGKKIAMIFQDPMSTLNPVFDVGEQLIRVIRRNMELSRKEAEKKAIEIIKLVKLPDAQNIMKKYPHELSGGQRQRIIIAIAISCGAELLIADEPTRNLDVTIQAGVLKLLANIKKNLNATVLFIANNFGLVSAMCDRVAILYKGKVVELGSTKEITKTPLHPYTLTLLQAIPRNREEIIEPDKVLLKDEMLNKSNGCSYFSRCNVRNAKCENESPVLKKIEGSQCVACFARYLLKDR